MRPTRNHDEIKRWAARHGAEPAEIKPILFDSEPSILYFLMGKARAGTREIVPITWDDFFARFDLLGLSMVYDDATPVFDLVRVEKPSGSSMQH